MNKQKIDSADSDELQTAISGTKHTVTTADNKILHRKHISKPISEIVQEQNSRGTGLRGPEGRFIKSPRITRVAISDSDSEKSNPTTSQLDTTQITEGTQFRDSQTTPIAKKSGSFRRLYPKPIQNRQNPAQQTALAR